MAVDQLSGTMATAAWSADSRRRSATEDQARSGGFTTALAAERTGAVDKSDGAPESSTALPTDPETLIQAIQVEKLVNWEAALERRIERFESLGTLKSEAAEQNDLIASLRAVSKETALTREQRELLKDTKADLAVTEHRIENFETIGTLQTRLDIANERFADLDPEALDAWNDVFHPTK